MKRDHDYIRDMLFEAEDAASDQYVAAIHDGDVKKSYHAKLLCDVGFFVQLNPQGVYRMTSQGHDYLDAIRDEGIWKKTKDAVAETGGSAALEIMKKLAMGFVETKLLKHAGLDL